jgi:hypothetical protein
MRRSLGSIDIRGGRHRARIRVDERMITLGTFTTVEEAESAIALFADANRTEQPFAGMSLQAWGRRWLDKRELDGVHRSVKKDRYVWRRVSPLPAASAWRLRIVSERGTHEPLDPVAIRPVRAA